MTPREISKRYRFLSKISFGKEEEFPFGTVPDNMGGYHVEYFEDGTFALVATERGMETFRRAANSIDELMFLVISSFAKSEAFHKEGPNGNFEESKQLALEIVGRVSVDWRDRLGQEFDAAHDLFKE